MKMSSGGKSGMRCVKEIISCVAVVKDEEFADEEDFVKGGGSELLFVQMQRNKAMDTQSKLSHRVSLSLSLSRLKITCNIECEYFD